jgi:hypothetical protein
MSEERRRIQHHHPNTYYTFKTFAERQNQAASHSRLKKHSFSLTLAGNWREEIDYM